MGTGHELKHISYKVSKDPLYRQFHGTLPLSSSDSPLYCQFHGSLVQERDFNAIDGAMVLKSTHRLTDKALDDVLHYCEQLVEHKLGEYRNYLTEQLPSEHQFNFAREGASLPKLFDDISTSYKRNVFLKTHYGMVEPTAIKMGNPEVEGKQKQCYVVNFKQQLQRLLSHPQVASTLEDAINTSSRYIINVNGGHYLRNDPFIREHPDCLLFSLYYDDFEVVNPIGAHRKKHKVAAYYWTLLNIPFIFRSQTQFIQLLAIVKTVDKKIDRNCYLKDFLDTIQELHTGIELNVNGETSIYYGKLTYVCGDGPALAEIGGFKESFSKAISPCLRCDTKNVELNLKVSEDQCQLRNLDSHKNRLQNISCLTS